jgi:hypothetical protein
MAQGHSTGHGFAGSRRRAGNASMMMGTAKTSTSALNMEQHRICQKLFQA